MVLSDEQLFFAAYRPRMNTASPERSSKNVEVDQPVARRLVISRSKRNFVGATLPGFYVDRDHYCGRDFDRRADDGSAEFERRHCRSEAARLIGSI